MSEHLDAQVAEVVMGWERIEHHGLPAWRRPDMGAHSAWIQHYPWQFSTSFDACALVLDRLRELGCTVEISLRPVGGTIARVQMPGRPVATAVADTLPHALCSAAVEAVRAKRSPADGGG